MIRKFQSITDKRFTKGLPFSYSACLPYLEFAAYMLEENKSSVLVVQDVLYKNIFPYIFLPSKKIHWANSHTLFATKEDVEKVKHFAKIETLIPIGEEFFYKTEDFISPTGKDGASLRRHIHHFENSYDFKIKDDCSDVEIDAFLKRWLRQQKEKGISFDESYDFFLFCVQHRNEYGMKTVFVEIDKKLAGIAMGVTFDKNNWVGLHLKVDYKYKGLSRFLHHKRAELFRDKKFFTLGHGTPDDKGIQDYKEALHPWKKIAHSYIITSSLIKK